MPGNRANEKRDASTPDTDLDIGELYSSLGFLLRMAQLQAFDQFFSQLPADTPGIGLKPGESTVLHLLRLNPGVRQGQLAAKLHIKPAHMTKLTQKLVDAGLIHREADPEDRRSVRLTLTRAGVKHTDHYRQQLKALHKRESEPLSEHEHKQLMALLRKLTGFGATHES